MKKLLVTVSSGLMDPWGRRRNQSGWRQKEMSRSLQGILEEIVQGWESGKSR